MRISKDGEERKQEFLQAALDLFSKRGYESTSVQDILNAVGVTKGAFYYYFKSKEEVVDELLGSFRTDMHRILSDVLADGSLNPLEKVVAMDARCLRHRLENRDYFERIYNTLMSIGNAKLRHKLNDDGGRRILPLFRQAIVEGAEKGLLDIPVPEETAELYYSLHSSMLYRLSKLCYGLAESPENEEKINTLLYFYQDTLERLLGAGRGMMNVKQAMEATIAKTREKSR
jgi:AcrR family transcriptional regulator